MKLSDSETRDSIEKIVQFLKDHLGQLDECKEAVNEIKKIRDDLSPTLEIVALRESVNEIRRELGICKNEIGDDVNSLTEELKKLQLQRFSRDDESVSSESESTTDKDGDIPKSRYDSETGYYTLAQKMIEDLVVKKQVDKAIKHPDLKKREFLKVLVAELHKNGKTKDFLTTDPLPFTSQILSDGDCRTFLQCFQKEIVDGLDASLEDMFVLLECDQENCKRVCWKCTEKEKLHDLALYYGHFNIADKPIHMKVRVSTMALCNAARHGKLTKVKEILETLKRNNAFHPSMETAKLSLCRAYISRNSKLIKHLLNARIILESHHIMQILEHGSIAALKDVLEHLKFHKRWQPESTDKTVYNAGKPGASEALLKAFLCEKFDMAALLTGADVELTMSVMPLMSENGSYESILKVMQHLEKTKQWDPKSTCASRALEVAYVMRKDDIRVLLIQEGVQLSMKNLPGIVRRCSVETVDKVINSLKEADKWDPRSRWAINALHVACTILNGDISVRLFQAGVPLTMENLTRANRYGWPLSTTDIIQNLKANDLWDPQSDKASEALECAYREQRENDRELLIKEGIQLKMKNFPGIVEHQTNEIVKKVIKTLKENGKWDPKSRYATEAQETAFTKSMNDICDILNQEGVSLTMNSLDSIAQYGSNDTVSKFVQLLKERNEWRSGSVNAKEALENAFKRQDDDLCALLIQEGVFLSMEHLPDIVRNVSLDTNHKVVQHLKDNQQWYPYSDNATHALANAFKEQRYEICDFLIKERVSLKMEILPELVLIESTESLFKAIQHLKYSNDWTSDSDDAYTAFINACMARMYEVCDILTDMGVFLAMEKLLDIVQYGTAEHVGKVIDHMKRTSKWNPNSVSATDALALARRERKNDISDLLIQEGVPLAPSKPPVVPISKMIRGKNLGKGAFGQVYLMFDQKDPDNKMAVKEIHHEGSKAENECAERLKNEVEILKGLNHARVVRCYGCEEDTKVVKIFMEYMPNGSVKDYMSKLGIPLKEDFAVKITKHILEGTAYLHENKIVHRDIKAANVLLDSEMNAKLADFGVSKQIRTLANSNACCISYVGTQLWMSPERIRGEEYGKGDDIWSIGCTVIEMFTMQTPWYNPEIGEAAIIYQIGNGEIPKYQLPSTESTFYIEDFLKQTFQQKASDRPRATELLKHHLFQEKKMHAVSPSNQERMNNGISEVK